MKKLYLEFIRGAAAITVLFYHFFELHTLSNHSSHFLFGNWGTDAVIIFFILSGVVINISQSNNPREKQDFIVNRLLRLYPQLIIGLLLGLTVLFITDIEMPSAGTIAGNFLMISAIKHYMVNIVPCLESNSPLWSLSYEIVFYLLFALSIGRFKKRALVFWFVASIAVMPVYYMQLGNDVIKHFASVLAFSSIWLVGYFVYSYRDKFYADKYVALFSAGALPLISRMHISTIYYDPAKYLLFAIAAIPFFRYCLQIPPKGKKIKWYYLTTPYLLVVYIVFNQPYLTFRTFTVYSALPVILMAICFIICKLDLKDKAAKLIAGTGKVLGRYSYSIYVIHYPVLFLCATYIHSAVPNLLISLPCIALLAYGLEAYIQPAIIAAFKQLQAIRITRAENRLPSLSQSALKLLPVRRIILPLVAAISWLATLTFQK